MRMLPLASAQLVLRAFTLVQVPLNAPKALEDTTRPTEAEQDLILVPQIPKNALLAGTPQQAQRCAPAVVAAQSQIRELRNVHKSQQEAMLLLIQRREQQPTVLKEGTQMQVPPSARLVQKVIMRLTRASPCALK